MAESYQWCTPMISSVAHKVGYMQKSRPLEAMHYSVHGPHSTISLCLKDRRVSYAANFMAQIPETITDRISEDYREVLNADLLSYFIELGENLSQ